MAHRCSRGIVLPIFQATTSQRALVSVVPFAAGVILLTLWLGPKDNFEAARFGVAAIVTGLAILFWNYLLKPAVDVVREVSAPPPLPAIRFLGRDTNLLTLQIMIALYMIERAYWWQVDSARWAAVTVIALASVLYPSKVRTFPILLATTATGYLLIITWLLRDFAFKVGVDELARAQAEFIVPLWPIFWTVALMAVFPQLAIVRWGRFRIGAIKGDIIIDQAGSPVLLAFGSAVLIAAVGTTIMAFIYTPYWVDVIAS